MNQHILLVTPPGYNWNAYIQKRFPSKPIFSVCSWDPQFIKFIREKAYIWLKCNESKDTILVLDGID